MNETLKKAWKWLDGNKTIICWGTSVALQEAVRTGLIDNSKGIQWIIGVTVVLGGGALGHHISKGYFTTKKGE